MYPQKKCYTTTPMSPIRESPPAKHTRNHRPKMDEIMQSHSVVLVEESDKQTNGQHIERNMF